MAGSATPPPGLRAGLLRLIGAAVLACGSPWIATGCGQADPVSPPGPRAGAPVATSATAPEQAGVSSVVPATAVASSLAPTTTPPAAPTTMPPPSPAIGPGSNRLFVLGDSVILGAQAQVPSALKGWDVTFDAKESRFIFQGLDELRAKVDDAQRPITEALGRVVVIHLCTNYEATGAFGPWIDRYMAYLKDVDRVVWVTCVEWSRGQVEANQAMRAAASKYRNDVVADWAPLARTPGYAYADGIHLQDPGRRALADLVARAVGPAPAPLPSSTSASTTTTSRGR